MIFRGHRRQLLRALRPLRSFISALQPSTSGLSCHTRGTEVQYPLSSLSHVTLHLHAVASSMSISSGSSNPVSSLDQYCRQHMAIFFNSHRLIQPVIRSLAGTQNASRGWPGSGFLKLTSITLSGGNLVTPAAFPASTAAAQVGVLSAMNSRLPTGT